MSHQNKSHYDLLSGLHSLRRTISTSWSKGLIQDHHDYLLNAELNSLELMDMEFDYQANFYDIYIC